MYVCVHAASVVINEETDQGEELGNSAVERRGQNV